MDSGESDDLADEHEEDIGNEYDIAKDAANNSFHEDDEGDVDVFGHPTDSKGNPRRRLGSEQTGSNEQAISKQSSGSKKKNHDEKAVPVLTFVDMSKLKYLSRSVN